MKAKRLAMNAVGIALLVTLSYFALDVAQMKLSFASFPIIVCALLFGWVDGMLVGGLGEFIIQIIKYGLMPTTILWIIPGMVRGVIIGLYAQRHKFKLSVKQTAGIVLFSSLVVTALNTVILYFDGIIFGYDAKLTLLTIALRFVSSVIMAVIYTAISPQVVRLIQKSGVTR